MKKNIVTIKLIHKILAKIHAKALITTGYLHYNSNLFLETPLRKLNNRDS